MATVHQLPDTFRGPERQGKLQPFPSDRPENLRVLRPTYADRPYVEPERYPLRPEAYILLALIETLETRKGLHRIKEDTFQTIVSMLHRWHDDEDVRQAMRPVLDLMCAGKTGRA